MVKLLDFFVSGQTCGQTEELMIFRHSGEPKKSVFVGVFGSSRKFYAERGDWVPIVALYQTEPHLDMKLFSFMRSFEYVKVALQKALLRDFAPVKSVKKVKGLKLRFFLP